jgi:malonyl-CoA/methylmalonyl-CoA synthetase
MERLFGRLETGGDGLALEVGAARCTFGELAGRARAHRARLLAAGVTPGAFVGVWTQPSLETAIALVANAVTGFVSVPLDPRLGPLELGHVAADARPVLTLAADVAAVEGRLPGVPVLGPDTTQAPGVLEGRLVDDAPLLVLYTSGTTGLPKGAVLSARNVAFDLDALARAWQWRPEDRVVHALPLFHVHGLVLGLFGSLRNGAGLTWLPRFEPEALVEAVARTGAMLFAVPTMYHRLAEAAAASPALAEGLGRAKLLVSGSAPLPTRDQLRIEALTGRRVYERYGLTETVINTAMRVDAPHVPGTVGPVVEGVELRLVDDARVPLDVFDDATLGEVAVRGPNVFLGYLNRPDATQAVRDAEGWFYTGDLATRRPDGALRIVGRRSVDLIKCGGYKVGAGEVEAALLEHPAVREAAVLGAPDDDLGERIVAFVVADPVSPAVLVQHVAQLLSPHKRPREVHLVEALPRNAMGKVVKAQLRQRR